MKKILIFGSRGMLGHIVSSYLIDTQKYQVIGSAIQDNKLDSHYPVDVCDPIAVEEYVRRKKPDIVINCVGILVNDSNNNVENAIKVNSLFPNILSRMGEELKYKLIHMSTDCVFSGNKGNYIETSTLNGESVYARTKILGEFDNNNNLIIRTSIIGPELKANGSGLLDWFLNQNSDVGGFVNAFWTGVTTLELAKGIDEFIKQDISGIYHFVSREKISKLELLKLIKKIWQKENIKITKNEEYKTDKSLLNTRTDFKFKVKEYEEMLIELKNWIDSNRNLYPHYR
jgi:dTDP-4-dehydrorhamnose reductase